jgi:hypothetical protein
MDGEQGEFEIKVDDASPLFDKTGMEYREFPSDYSQIRFYAMTLTKSAPQGAWEVSLLEQQVSEIIKNAIKHGNKNDLTKKVRVWRQFTPDMAHFIVEDEGEGFKELEQWNAFSRKRFRRIREGNDDELGNYASFRGDSSDESDGGNALFAAVEYWNAGIVFNKKRNAVALKKLFKARACAAEAPTRALQESTRLRP